MFDSRVILSAEVKADIEKFLTNARSSDRPWAQCQIIPVHIRRNIKLAEAPSYGKTIFEYEPKCHGADDYYKVAEFIHAMSRDAVDNTVEVIETTEVTNQQRIVDIPHPADTEPATKNSLT
jgi:chromosome partitioning protein